MQQLDPADFARVRDEVNERYPREQEAYAALQGYASRKTPSSPLGLKRRASQELCTVNKKARDESSLDPSSNDGSPTGWPPRRGADASGAVSTPNYVPAPLEPATAIRNKHRTTPLVWIRGGPQPPSLTRIPPRD